MASPQKVRLPAHPSRPGARSGGTAGTPASPLRPGALPAGSDSPSGKFQGVIDPGNILGDKTYDNAVDPSAWETGFSSTAYGPPWEGIQGTGVTAGGTNLKDGHPAYIVAVDPSVIPLGTELYIHPNPFGYKGRFLADDTGGAIKGKRIDFYDWRGRASQIAWGRRTVAINRVKGGKFNVDPSIATKVGDALGDPLAAFKELAKMAMALFYPGTWVRIGKVVGGFLLVMWGVNALLKSSFGIDVGKAVKKTALTAAVVK